jgi:nucleoside 2-deoxyribosyltransferase
MAFGHADCDTIYNRHIAPTLAGLGISPIRVDRRQHRDDLNNYIIRMLKDSDIVIADLTYARPSVYYEAGFAERTVPVVYTVRSDHLSWKHPDDSQRVHFDLAMKKIVSWDGPTDGTFAKRLRQRIAYLIEPILKQVTQAARLEEERSDFLRRSISNRCALVRRAFESQLRAKRFWARPLGDLDTARSWELQPASVLVGAKLVKETCVLCVVVVGDSIGKKQIEWTLNGVSSSYLVDAPRKETIREYTDYYYFCSLRKLPDSRLTSLFPESEPTLDTGTYRIEKQSRLSQPRHVVIALISPIESLLEARSSARKLIMHHPSEKTNKYTGLVPGSYGKQSEIVFERSTKR